MKKVQKYLLTLAAMPIVVSLGLAILFETDAFHSGMLANKQPMEFIVLTILEIVSIAVIPLAISLFKIGRIRRDFSSDSTAALMKWGALRITLIGDTLILNTLCYYLFQTTAFAYLAIILLLTLIYLFPTKHRCEVEITNDEQ